MKKKLKMGKIKIIRDIAPILLSSTTVGWKECARIYEIMYV